MKPRTLKHRETGLSLVELLMAVSILSVIASAFFAVTHTTLESWAATQEKDQTTDAGRVAMERITQGLQATNRVILPFERAAGDTSTHHVLCVALGVDNDGDGLVDEDSYDVFHDGTAAGIPGIDDDWDGTIDEGQPWDDDESGWVDEDEFDGKTNDGDTRVDEDWGWDMNGDGKPGVAYVDDDGDGWVDEGSSSDDDEDGRTDEDPIEPVVYCVHPTIRPPRLEERHPTDGTTVLVDNLYYENEDNYADGFIATRLKLADGATLIHIRLRIASEAGEITEFQTTVTTRNAVAPKTLVWSPAELPGG